RSTGFQPSCCSFRPAPKCPQADVGGRRFGDWVLLMPTKMSGGTYAVNLNTGRALAWISYWNYGDYNPISHHLCAVPSADPAKGFEWINSTQGGKNSLIYGIPTQIETPGEGFNIYRLRYDGSQMEAWRTWRKPRASVSACT